MNPVKLLEFERDCYRLALEELEVKLNDLANDREEERINFIWIFARDALDRRKLAVAAAEVGLLTDVFE